MEHPSPNPAWNGLLLTGLAAFLVLALTLPVGCGKQSAAPSTAGSAHGSEAEAEWFPHIKGEPYVHGRAVWIKNCKLCHEDGGEDEAPVLGNKSDWADRIAKGLPTLTKNAFEGIGMMPARGGRKKLSDEDLKSAIQYMVKASE